MNKVYLIGNLTRDPEMSTTTSGISVCRMSIAVGRRFPNAEGGRDADFFNITAWRGPSSLSSTVSVLLTKSRRSNFSTMPT